MESKKKICQVGIDDAGRFIGGIDTMWSEVITQDKTTDWYQKAASYWDGVEASYEGVLGGFAYVSPFDVKESGELIDSLQREMGFGKSRAIDCGAGVGRVTKDLLQFKFEKVDVMEQNPKYIEEAQRLLKDSKNVSHFYAKGMQEFKFEESYDCIWIQWAISHLTDEDFVSFLQKAAKSLKKNGVIVMKENISRIHKFILHKEDMSITRSEAFFEELIERAGLKIVREVYQKEFPEELFPVCMFVVQPWK